MADKTINTKVRLRYDSEANWKSKDPVLLSGEMAISSDKNGMHKVGNGTSKWSALSYVKASLDKNDVVGALGYTPPTSNTWRGVQNNLTSDATDQSLAAAQGKVLKGLVDGKAASSHTHDDRYYTESEMNTKLSAYLPLSGGTTTGVIKRSSGGSWISARNNVAVLGTATGKDSWNPVVGQATPNGYWTIGNLASNDNLAFSYTTNANYTAGSNTASTVYLPTQEGTIITSATIGSQSVSYAATAGRLNTARTISLSGSVTGSAAFDGNSNITISTSTNHTHSYAGSSSAGGSANSAVKLSTARSINGTNFDGSGNITTATWGTARTLTIGNTGKSVNGSGNVSWSLSEIGAAAASHTHSYLPLSGGAMTGSISYKGSKATYEMIKFIDNTLDSYGNGIAIGGGGLTIVGGGESADVIKSSFTTGGTESLVLANDGAIDFYTNCQDGISNATHVTIDNNGLYSGTAAKANSVAWSNVSGKPSTFTPSSHTHSYAGSSSAGGAANSTNAINWVAGNEIRFTKPSYSSATSLHIGWAWADGSKSKLINEYIFDGGDGNRTQVTASQFNGPLNGNATSASSVPWSGVTGKPGTVGSSTQPIYFSNGTATACAYTLGKSVPSNAVFTDTNTWRGIQNNLTSTSTTDSLSAYQGKILNESKLTRVEWNCVLKCATWSRVCYISAKSGVTGSAFLFNIYGTRSSVVFHNTYMIKAHHSNAGCITKISGSTYGSSGSIRLIVDSTGNCYVEYFDTGNGATNSTTQSVNCTLLNIAVGGVTTYTSFTDGSSIPSGYTKAAQIDMNTNSLQGNLTWNEITGKPSTFAPSSHTHSYAGSSSAGGSANSAVKLDSSAGSSTQPVYFSGGKPVACSYTIAKSVPSNAVFTDTNTWRPLGTTADTACAGNDSRLSNARPASDVYSWAKASSKPSYSWSEISGRPSSLPANGGSANTANYLATYALNGDDNLKALQNNFDSIPKSVGTAVRLQHGSHSMGFGWFLSGYEKANAYGGWFISNYGTPSWIGVDGGTWKSCDFITTNNISGQSVNYATSAGSANSVAWGNVSGKPSTFTPSSHTHNYAGSSSAGGAATSANKLNTNAGSSTQPVYFSNGVPVACSYTLGKSVPSNAVFTDTNTWRGVQNNLTSDSTSDSLSAAQGKVLKGLVDGKAASSHSHYLDTLTGYHGTLNFANFSDDDYLIMSDSKGSVGCIDAGAVCATENIVDNLSSTSSVLPLSANQGRVLNSKIGKYYKLYSCQNVQIDVGSIPANSFSGKVSKTFTKTSGATYFIPIQIEGGWLTCTYMNISGNTLTVEFANWSNGAHSGGGKFIVLQFGEPGVVA